MLIRGGFQGTAAGSADTDDTAACCLCLIDQVCLLLFYHVKLGMHVMLCDILYLDRSEGTETHMQGDMSKLYSLRPDLLQKLRCKMQAGCGCCSGAVMLCIDGLIAVLIL